MEIILIHVSEFGSWVASSKLNVDLRRVIFVKNNDFNSFSQLLDAYGNIRVSEPEAYIVAILKHEWRQSIQRASISSSGSKASLGLESVFSFQALTGDAQLRLNSQTERLSIKLSPPEFEVLWRDFQSQSQLQQARESGETFLGLYSFPAEVSPSCLAISDLLLSNLLTRINDYKSERTLEGLKGFAEYGPTEFGIRISSAHSEEWRRDDERYIRFRQIRSEKLSKKLWNDVSYLDFPELRNSILSFDSESRSILGVPPLAAVSYFKFYAEFILQGGKLSFEGINKTAAYLLSLGHAEDCFNFIFMLGAVIGPEQVATIKYRSFKDSFSIFNQSRFTKSDEILDLNLFRIIPNPIISLVSPSVNSSGNFVPLIPSEVECDVITGTSTIEKIDEISSISNSKEEMPVAKVKEHSDNVESKGLSRKEAKKKNPLENNENYTNKDVNAKQSIQSTEEVSINIDEHLDASLPPHPLSKQQMLLPEVSEDNKLSNEASGKITGDVSSVGSSKANSSKTTKIKKSTATKNP
jgi:hypothetical protein